MLDSETKANRNPALDGYETFIAEIKSNLDTMNLAEAIRLAIKTCLSKNILVYFLREHGSEVENMLLTEWNTEEAISVAIEEAVLQTAKSMLLDGLEPARVARITKLPEEQIMALR